MSEEEIKELKDYHKRCIESIDNYYLSDSFYEIHNKVFKQLDLYKRVIDEVREFTENYDWYYQDIKDTYLEILDKVEGKNDN